MLLREQPTHVVLSAMTKLVIESDTSRVRVSSETGHSGRLQSTLSMMFCH